MMMNVLRSSRKRTGLVAHQRRGLLTVGEKYLEGYRRFGWRECLWKLYMVGDLKFGDFKGSDEFGNKYYEDVTEQHGQSRWCEYRFDHSAYDSSQIPPQWHAWMHHITDFCPGTTNDKNLTQANYVKKPIVSESHADLLFSDHVGYVDKPYVENTTGMKSRGYGVGSINHSPDAPDRQYLQPNHALRNRKRTNNKDMQPLDTTQLLEGAPQLDDAGDLRPPSLN